MIITSSRNGDPREKFRRVIPPLLSFVSGFVDTCGFLGFAGLLTSQVTGSFVAASAAFVHRDNGLVPRLLAMPMFMVGACAMTLMVAVLKRRQRHPMPMALGFVATLITLFLIFAVAGQPFRSPGAPGAILATTLAFVAMGAESALVRVLFKGALPANFMTGNVTQVAVEMTELVMARLGILHVGDAAADSARASAASAQLKLLFPMISCFILGTVISAHAFIAFGFWSLLLATGLVFAAALWASRLESAKDQM